MSPKLREYPKRHIGRTRPMPSSGTGVGFATPKEEKTFEKLGKIVFTLIRLTSLAQNVKMNQTVFPFHDRSVVYIESPDGRIGEAPAKVAPQIISILNHGLRFDGYISKISTKDKSLFIEITLEARK